MLVLLCDTIRGTFDEAESTLHEDAACSAVLLGAMGADEGAYKKVLRVLAGVVDGIKILRLRDDQGRAKYTMQAFAAGRVGLVEGRSSSKGRVAHGPGGCGTDPGIEYDGVPAHKAGRASCGAGGAFLSHSKAGPHPLSA